jgi:hypothetical protein
MKRINILVIGLILTLIVIACSTGRINSLERRADECIVIAKVKILNYNEDITKESTLSFDGIVWSHYKVEPDDSSYIYFKLPLGKHFLGRIEYNGRSINLPKRMLVFETPESKVYYLGHISTELSLENSYPPLFLGTSGLQMVGLSTLGWMAYETREVYHHPILIENKIKEAQIYFDFLFPYNVKITRCAIKVDTTKVFSDSTKLKGPQHFFKD